MKTIDQGWLQNRCVAYGVTLAVIGEGMFGRSARKIRGVGMSIVSQGAAPEESVVPAPGEFVVGSRDVPIVVGGNSSSKAISDKIEQVPLAEVIGLRKGVEILEHDRVVANSQRVHSLDLCRSQGGDKTEGRIVDHVHLGIACGAIRVAGDTYIANHALA